jgi:integrase
VKQMESHTMPRPRSAQPAYQFHVSGQGRVILAGEDYYLGPHGSPESYARYFALLAEYNANGKQPPQQPKRLADTCIRMRDITADFRHRELPNYESNNGQYSRFSNLCDLLDARHGDEPTSEFGPRKLETLRDTFVAKGNCRSYCNTLTRMIIRIIEHGVSRELVQPDRIVALEALKPLKEGQARESQGRSGVAIETIKATLPFLTATAAAMVRIQFATAMRPSELFRMTPAMIDRSGANWFYRPTTHKTAHHGKTKAVPIIGEALEALTPYLFGAPESLCFLTMKGTEWNKDSYRIAVARAAKAAGVEHWTPYQIRHTAAQAVRDNEGPEATQALLGHSRLSTTEIYAKANEVKALEGARAVPMLG